VAAIAHPLPAEPELVDAVDLDHPGDGVGPGDAEVLYLPVPFEAVELVERPTSLPALVLFALGLSVAVVFAVSAPALAGLALVGGIIGGGILNAPAGDERRRTAAALGLPALALLGITAAFLSAV
jgi:hypothetical protein